MPIRKFAILMLMSFGLSLPAFATYGASTQWNVTTTGIDTDGGAFDLGVASPGTDLSQSAGVSITCTVGATTTQAVCVPALTSTTYGPGNFIGPMTGTGCTLSQWTEELSQSSGTGTFDRSLGTAASVCTGTIGGPLLTISTATAHETSNNCIHVQTGTYTLTSVISVLVNRVFFDGYQTTYFDFGTPPLITTATNSTYLFGVSGGSYFVYFDNFSFSNTAATNHPAFYDGTASPFYYAYKCIFNGFSAIGSSEVTGTIDYSEVKNSSTYGVGLNISVYNSWVHGSTSGGIQMCSAPTCSGTYANDLITNNSGPGMIATADFANLTIENCTIANNSGTGIDISASGVNLGFGNTFGFKIYNNVLYGNGGWGIKGGSFGASLGFNPVWSTNNAYGDNTSGAKSNWTDTKAVTLSVDPFVNDASKNYALNTTTGGGASLRGAGAPASFPGGLTANYPSIGAAQVVVSGGSGASNYGYAR